jgi:hypothetical protein
LIEIKSKKDIELNGWIYEMSTIKNRHGEFILIRQIEEGDTKGGIIILKDKFEEFVKFQRGTKHDSAHGNIL